ncbi:MAG: polysaccharide export protein EpsE [Methylophilaceae bacterium]
MISRWLLACCFLFWASIGYAAENEMLLGPGDVLKISVFDQPDLSLEVRVSENGTITFPLIGEVKVGGSTTAVAESKIAEMLESGGFIRSPHVNVLVTQLQSQQVSVLGQVNHPGRYPIEGTRTLSDVIALASGISPDGGDIVTVIRTREGKTTRDQVDLLHMMQQADITKNTTIAGGDIVFVERAPKFYIYGEVQRPGQYRLERNMTVLQALSAGAGLTQRGTERGVRIKRRDERGEIKVIAAKHDDLLQPDDVVYVKESLF